MANSKHPWYETWKYHRRKPRFPWKNNFRGFVHWAEQADYNPGNGDQIKQRELQDEYRIYIERADGSVAPMVYIIRHGVSEYAIPRDRLREAFFAANRDAIYRKPDGVPNCSVTLTEQRWCMLGKAMGLEDTELYDALRPLELVEVDAANETFQTQRIRDVFTRMHESCYNTGSAAYEVCGARGVMVTDPWHDFDTFKEWAEKQLEQRQPNHDSPLTLLRTRAFEGFCPANCKLV